MTAPFIMRKIKSPHNEGLIYMCSIDVAISK